MAEINLNNWNVICRTCLCDQAEHSILSLRLINNKRMTIKDILLTVTQLEIIYPGLPSYICTKCIQHLEAAYSFSENCIRVEKILIGASKKLKAQLPKAETSLYEHTYYGVPSGSQPQSYGYLEQLLRHTVSSEGNYGDNLADDFIEMDDRANGMKGEVAVQANKLLAQPSHQNQLQTLHPLSQNHHLQSQSHLSQLQNQPIPLRNHPLPLENHPPPLQNHPPSMQTHPPQLQSHQNQIQNHQPHNQLQTQLCHQPLASHRLEHPSPQSQMLPSHQLQPQREQIASHNQASMAKESYTGEKNEIRKDCKERLSRKKLQNFQCRHCEKFYTTKSARYVHEKKLHNDKTKSFIPRTGGEFLCEPCNKYFSSKLTLKKHRFRIHKEPTMRKRLSKFKCKECSKLYVNATKFIQHLKVEHPHVNIESLPHIAKMKCCSCDKAFATGWDLKMHKRKEHNLEVESITRVKTVQSDFKCGWCGTFFSAWSSLNRHLMKVHQQETLRLNIKKVQKDYEKIRLRPPRKTNFQHEAPSQIRCELCDINFLNYSARSNHLKFNH